LQGEFRAITAADIDAVLLIERDSFQEPWERRSFLSELTAAGAENLALCRAAASGRKEIVAYIFLRWVLDELHVLKIAVAPVWRRSEFGTVLMNKSLELAAAKGCTAAYLEVRPANRAAMALYRKLGFRLIGRRTNYYSETGEDALVMRKNLREDL